MSNPYTTVALSGYNSDPPSDDGSATSNNQLGWQKHIDKIGDPLRVGIQAVNTNLLAAFALLFGADIDTYAVDYTVTTADRGKFLEATAALTFTLPTVASAGTAFPLGFVNNGSGLLTIDGASSETINGATSIYLGPGESATLTTDGASWTALISRRLANRVQSKSANYSAAASDDHSLLEFTATATLSLLAAATAGAEYKLLVTNNSTALVTIDGSSSETINGATTITLYPGASCLLVCTGVAWYATLSQGQQEQHRHKTADNVAVNSSTTLITDTHLAGIPLEAGIYYALEAEIYATTAIAMDFALALSETPQCFMWELKSADGDTNLRSSRMGTTAGGELATVAASSGDLSVKITALFQANATTGGTVGLQFAQNSSDGTDSLTKDGSWMKVTRLLGQ